MELTHIFYQELFPRQENYFNMIIEEINEIVKNVQDKPNKDLIECRDILFTEFQKTKQLIIDLTRHLDAVEISYEQINAEIGKRLK